MEWNKRFWLGKVRIRLASEHAESGYRSRESWLSHCIFLRVAQANAHLEQVCEYEVTLL
jgi:hypothetical protein